MKRLIILLPILAITLFVFGVILNSNTAQNRKSNKIQVAAAENVYGNIAAQIGGRYISVYSILHNPDQDPHAYDPTVDDARNVATATLIIDNGAGYDSFMDKLLATKTTNQKIITVASLGGKTANDNPHLWYNITSMSETVRALTNDLCLIDTVHASYYKENEKVVLASFNEIRTEENNLKARANGKLVLATERVADYLLSDSGFTIIPNDFQKAIEEGNDPSANAITFFQNTLQKKRTAFLIYNTQTTSGITEKMRLIAKQHTIPIIGVEETLPNNYTYQAWIFSKLSALSNDLHTT